MPARTSTIVAILLLLACWPVAAQLETDADPIGDFESELQADTDTWHLQGWRWRRRVTLVDPRVTVAQSRTVLLAAPDPLLLMNTQRLRRDAGDLRVVDLDGKALRCGVVNAGQDDGSSLIWCELPRNDLDGVSAHSEAPEFWLYYGQPEATVAAAGPGDPGETGEAMAVRLGPERGPDGAEAAPTMGPWGDLVFVEGEAFRDAAGSKLTYYKRQGESDLALAIRAEASGGSALVTRATTGTTPGWAEATIPTAGRWTLHARYRVAAKTPERATLALTVGEQTLTFGRDHRPGREYRWESQAVELAAGPQPLVLALGPDAGLDCLLFSRDPGYQPDHRDVSGPVWMRFRVPAEVKAPPFFLVLYCVITPWSTHGPTGEVAGFTFRDRSVRPVANAEALGKSPELYLHPGEWTPWIEALESTMPTWWSEVSLHHRWHPSWTRAGIMMETPIEYEFATRPNPQRVFRRGRETPATGGKLHIIMPRSGHVDDVLANTWTFRDWAAARYRQLEGLGLPPATRPERIFVTTMGTATARGEAAMTLKTLAHLGFNGAEFRSPDEPAAYWAMAEREGLGWDTQHHWYPRVDPVTWPDAPAAGQTAEETMLGVFRAAAAETYRAGYYGGPESYLRTRLAILGDEIGPATSGWLINTLPLVRSWFHEYLMANDLQPDFFDAASWDEVQAYVAEDYPPGSKLPALINQIREARGLAALAPPVDPEIGPLPTVPPPPDWDSAPSDATTELAATMREEADRQAALLAQDADPAATSVRDRRLWYWTQRFLSYYTNRYYRTGMDAIREHGEAGDFRRMPLASPNFQAAPIMTTQMWNGAPNIFEWARMDTTNHLLIEDWITDPHRVMFGMRILQAAARKHGQSHGLLVVGGNMKTRYLAGLGSGGTTFLSYLYGPLRTIGPPWADRAEDIVAWHSALDATGRHEADLLASKPRPARVAVLVAVSSDINVRYGGYVYSARRLSERGHIYSSLLASHINAEVISEEEILEDDALARYDVIYAADPHARTPVLQRLDAWVRAGGTLWATRAALSHDEYDQPSPILDAAFGLTARPRPAHTPDAIEDEPMQTIRVADTAGLTDITFQADPVRADWQLADDTDILARYADGAPAYIHHRHGQGQTYLYGSTVQPLTSGYGPTSEEPADAPARRRLVAIAADRVQPDMRLSHPRVIAWLLDGPDRAVLVLMNCADTDLADIRVDLRLPFSSTTATRGDGSAIPLTTDTPWTTLHLPLDLRDGDIIVIKKTP